MWRRYLMMWNWGPWMGWGGMVFGGFLFLLFWVAVIALVVWAVAKVARGGDRVSSPTPRQSPLDIAKERYARGEISREEFEQLKQDLS